MCESEIEQECLVAGLDELFNERRAFEEDSHRSNDDYFLWAGLIIITSCG